MKAEKTLSERFNDAFRSLERTRGKETKKISERERELGEKIRCFAGVLHRAERRVYCNK